MLVSHEFLCIFNETNPLPPQFQPRWQDHPQNTILFSSYSKVKFLLKYSVLSSFVMFKKRIKILRNQLLLKVRIQLIDKRLLRIVQCSVYCQVKCKETKSEKKAFLDGEYPSCFCVCPGTLRSLLPFAIEVNVSCLICDPRSILQYKQEYYWFNSWCIIDDDEFRSYAYFQVIGHSHSQLGKLQMPNFKVVHFPEEAEF